MARKKKKAEEFIRAGITDNLVKISIRHAKELEELRALNPEIKNCIAKIPAGRMVRIT